MVNLLEERLRSNSNAFEGLLSLIPAKYYYDDQTQEQWKAKKKSKSQAKEDKQKKLDPEQHGKTSLSTLEVMKEREKDAKPVVLPGEKLKKLQQHREVDEEKEGFKSDEIDGGEEIDVIFDDEGNEINLEGDDEELAKTPKNEPKAERKDESKGESKDESKDREDSESRKMLRENIKEEVNENVEGESEEKPIGEGNAQTSKPNLDALRFKLQAKIQDLKEKRKAPGTRVRGAPSSREAIIEERKRKLDSRKQKEDFQKQQNSGHRSGDESESDEDDSDVEAEQPTKKSRIDIDPNDLMFQNIEFDDGNKITSDLQHLRRGPKKKGPAKNDIKAHLKILEAKKSKLESKDEMDQVNAKDKEKWQRAALQAEGIRLKDDEKLLRKALKRKEAKKKRSAQEWKERQSAVKTSKAEKQKRRDENLQIRKQNKGVKRSKQQKMKHTYKGNSTTVKRAGFEGRLKSGKKK